MTKEKEAGLAYPGCKNMHKPWSSLTSQTHLTHTPYYIFTHSLLHSALWDVLHILHLASIV